MEGAVRGLDALERVSRSVRAAGGGRSGQGSLLPAAVCRASRVTLAYPRAVVAEDGESKEPVRVRQPVAGLVAAGVAAGIARRQGRAFGKALTLGPSVRAALRPPLCAEEIRHRPVPRPAVREYYVGDKATWVRGISSRPSGSRGLHRGLGVGHRRQRG